MPENCLSCQYVYFDSGSDGYSEVTPGYGMSFYCTKEFWEIERNSYKELDKLEEYLQYAKTCTEYENRHDVNLSQTDKPVFYTLPDPTQTPHTQINTYQLFTTPHDNKALRVTFQDNQVHTFSIDSLALWKLKRALLDWGIPEEALQQQQTDITELLEWLKTPYNPQSPR